MRGPENLAMAAGENAPEIGARVFISYASEDAEYAQLLYAELLKAGFEPWMDKPPAPYEHRGLRVGQRWRGEVERALRSADYIILMLSTRSVQKRGFVRYEFRVALDLMNMVPDGKILVLPIRLDDCVVPELRVGTILLTDLQWQDVRRANIPQFAVALHKELMEGAR